MLISMVNIKNMRIFLLLFSSLLLWSACTPEFNLNDEYQDVTIVYGMLNPQETVQYIKIYKGFLTDGNAYTYASELENITYGDSIKVTLEEYLNKKLNREIELGMTTDIPKDSGEMAYPIQILYYTNATINTSAEYKLVIENKYTGRQVTSNAKVVGVPRIIYPYQNQSLDMTEKDLTIKVEKAENAVGYDLYQSFYYIEVDKNSKEVVNTGVVTRKLNGVLQKPASSSFDFKCSLADIYPVIGKQLKPNDTIIRYIDSYDCVELTVWGAGESYVTYLDVNTQTQGVVETTMNFTNIETEDGKTAGFFSSRNKISRKHKVSGRTQDSLVFGSYTKHLGFGYIHEYLSE